MCGIDIISILQTKQLQISCNAFCRISHIGTASVNNITLLCYRQSPVNNMPLFNNFGKEILNIVCRKK